MLLERFILFRVGCRCTFWSMAKQLLKPKKKNEKEGGRIKTSKKKKLTKHEQNHYICYRHGSVVDMYQTFHPVKNYNFLYMYTYIDILEFETNSKSFIVEIYPENYLNAVCLPCCSIPEEKVKQNKCVQLKTQVNQRNMSE